MVLRNPPPKFTKFGQFLDYQRHRNDKIGRFARYVIGRDGKGNRRVGWDKRHTQSELDSRLYRLKAPRWVWDAYDAAIDEYRALRVSYRKSKRKVG